MSPDGSGCSISASRGPPDGGPRRQTGWSEVEPGRRIELLSPDYKAGALPLSYPGRWASAKMIRAPVALLALGPGPGAASSVRRMASRGPVPLASESGGPKCSYSALTTTSLTGGTAIRRLETGARLRDSQICWNCRQQLPAPFPAQRVRVGL
jgi:hypothetical protein